MRPITVLYPRADREPQTGLPVVYQLVQYKDPLRRWKRAAIVLAIVAAFVMGHVWP